MPVELQTAQLVPENDGDNQFEDLSPKPIRGWTTGLTIICIFSVLIGIFGSIGAVVGMSQQFSKQHEIKNPYAAQDDQSQRFSLFTQKFAGDLLEAQRKYRPVMIFMELVKFGLAIAFFIGCYKLLAKRPNGHSFVSAICGCAIFYHFCFAIFFFVLSFETRGSTETLTGAMMSEIDSQLRSSGQRMSRQERESAAKSAAAGIQAALIFGAIVNLVIKGVFYGLMMIHLKSAAVRELFGEDAYKQVAMQV